MQDLPNTIPIDSIAKSVTLTSTKLNWPRQQPFPAFPSQNTSWAATVLPGGTSIPPVELQLVTLHNISFIVSGGYDGIMIDESGRAVSASLAFTAPLDAGDDYQALPNKIGLRPIEESFDEIFVGFDSGWTNYFHWICYALPKCYIAARILPSTCVIGIPDYNKHAADPAAQSRRMVGYSENVWRGSLEFFGLGHRVTALPAGVYRAKTLHMIWPKSRQPEELINTDLFYTVFRELRQGLYRGETRRRLIYISRKGVRDLRMTSDENGAIEKSLSKLGVEILAPHKLTFPEQVQRFHDASLVVGAHGAGLVNILFGRDDLKILELNRCIAPELSMRPWFYVMAARRNLVYSYLDGTERGFPTSEIVDAVERLKRESRI